MKIEYIEQDRTFSIKTTLTGPWGFRCEIPTKSWISKVILPQVAMTAYKYRPNSEAIANKDQLPRMKELYSNLLKLHPEIPVLNCSFNNACYIKDLKNILEGIEDEKEREFQILALIGEYGLDEHEFRSKLSNNMIFIGRLFKSPETLAHELGHYLCWNNMSEIKGGYEAHVNKSSKLSKLSDIFYELSKIGVMTFRTDTARNIASISMIIGKLSKALSSRPILKSEMAASQTGMILLKKAGATEDELADQLVDLTDAYKSYKMYYLNKELISALGGAALIAARYGIQYGVDKLKGHKANRAKSKG